jgi:cation transport ATPase
MKKLLTIGLFALTTLAAHAEYEQVNLTVFGMDCAPCAHAIRVSMKGISGVNNIDVDLNTGLVTIKLSPGNNASMSQFNAAVEKNGFTHKDANVTVRGHVAGSAAQPFLEVAGTSDRYSLVALGSVADWASLLGKAVVVDGVVPQSAKGKVSDVLRYKTIVEVK